MVDDEQLLREIQHGSEPAMEVLTRRYYQTVFAFVYRKTGNRELTSDLTQEIFIKMMKKIRLYSSKGSFKNWLFTIAVNHCRDYWRSAAFKAAENSDNLPESLPGKMKDTPFIFEQKEQRRHIISFINALPDVQKEVVILRYYHDLKIREIAAVAHSPEATVKSRLRQAIGKLRTKLQRGDDHREQQ